MTRVTQEIYKNLCVFCALRVCDEILNLSVNQTNNL